MIVKEGHPAKAPSFAQNERISLSSGALILNADDWGLDQKTTARILECICSGTVSSVSGMVFMEDSERAAAVARERGIDTGLHLNFTAPFTARGVSKNLIDHQRRVLRYLRGHRFAQVIFHPGLSNSFTYAVSAQLDEFSRLYGAAAGRIDGHHHMHLCANVLFANLLPAGTLVRRNFSFQPGEKGFLNLRYRQIVDKALGRRHRLSDYLFALAPIEPAARLERMFSLSREFTVEIETHPVIHEEYRFLTSHEFLARVIKFPLATHYARIAHG